MTILTSALFGCAHGMKARPIAPAAAYLAWERTLSRYVHSDGRGASVDYRELRRHRRDLDTFLSAVAWGLPFDGGEDRKGFFLDVYNACVLGVIADHPSLRSIQELGDPFHRPLCNVQGRKRTLDEIEVSELRATGDARVHMALNCASRGCPDLANRPWRGPGLAERLDEAARAFLSQPAHLVIDGGREIIFVSRLFAPDWLGQDFSAYAGSLDGWLARYGPPSLQSALRAGYRVAFLPYDWALNAE